jgi:DNA-binding NtrC family response regulator
VQFLLVEDDADLRREVGEYLMRRHHGVTALASAAEARGFLERRPMPVLDSVLCDVNLPDGDGFELYVRYAAQSAAVRWVLLTGDADPHQLDEIRRTNPGLPAALLVEKPVSLRRIAALLERGTGNA